MNEQRRQELNDIAALMATPHGRRFLWRTLSLCGVYRLSYTGNSETFFREGARNVGLQLLADVEEAAHEDMLTMMREAKRNERPGNGDR